MEFTDDDDGDCPVPAIVTEYHFVNEKDDPICFSVLPFRWDEDQILEAAEEKVFIYGEIDDGLQKIYKQVIAWNVQVLAGGLQIQVLSKDKTWLKIRKPRKSYQETIRSILITLECLSYLKMNPSSSEKSLWDHARKTYSHFEVSPCKDDLMVQKTIIQSMVERDETLLKAEVLAEILRSSSKKRSSDLMGIEDSPDEGVEDDQKSQSFNDGDDHDDDDDGREGDQYDGHDHVCAICDNGGDLLCCEGECLRSFHATKSAGADSQCKTLGYTRAQVKAIQNFVCPNCLHKKHQCFACGELGNSDKESGPEVFRCMSTTCGHFYHPGCVAKLLNPENDDEASSLEAKTSSGGSFLCPVHQCRVCKQFENKEIEELQFAICRRCPKSYHRKCLPRKIAFEGSDDEEVEQRAWEDLIPDRILIYCLKHKIDSEIGTPERNHITFPGSMKGKTVVSPDSKKKKVLTKGKTEISPSEKKKPKKRRFNDVEREEYGALKSPKASSLRKITKNVTKMSKSKHDVALSSVLENGFELSELSLNEKLFEDAKGVSLSIEEPELDSPVTLNDEDAEKRKHKKCGSNIGTPEGRMVKSPVPKKKKVLAKRKAEVPSSEKEKRPRKLIKLSSNEDLDGSTSRQPLHPSKCLKEPKDFTNMPTSEKKSSLKDETNFCPIIRTGLEHSVDEFNSSVSLIDEDARKRILLLVKKSPSSSLRVKDFLRKKQFSAAYLYGMKNIANTITHGKVEASVEAIRAALQKFENGSSIEDAKAVCGPDILNQMVIWKKKLKGYLGPLLHGMHDSSYGQHVKELGEVEEMASRVHWYVADGDMVVDVCCGAKDFSRLAKKKLDSTGKKCSFKNCDIFLPGKNSNWERRGWMAVQPKELQRGSQLVIWLDLPVGVNTSHAHKLIDKTLTFKPKILALLSPKEIDRLDTQAEEAYDLIWEQKLSGQIYHTGSNEASHIQSAGRKQRPLILYLWSRSDWTSKHRMTAIKCGHCLKDPKMDHNLLDETIESENGGNHEVEDERVKFSKIEELEEKPRRRSEEQLRERTRDLPLEMGPLPCHQAKSPKPGGDRGKSRERNESYQKARSYGQDERPGEKSRSLDMGVHPHHRMQREKSGERSKVSLKRSYGNDERPGENRSLERGFHRHQSGPERSPKSRRREKSGERNEGYQRARPYGQDETVLSNHQVGPERSPKSSEREKQKETTKMKYHWTCLYSQDDQPDERTSAGPSESSLPHHHRHQSGPEAQTDSPKPITGEKQSGERTEMRYHWSDLYAQDGQREEIENRGPSEMRLSLPLHHQSGHETLEELHYRAKVDPRASDRQLSIPPGFPSHHQLLPGHMRNSPSLLERESQTWINEEMPRHPIHYEVNDFQMGSRYNYSNQHELGQRGLPLSPPSYGFSSGSIGYRMNFGSAQWVDQPRRMGGDSRVWEMSEQVGPAHLRPRYESNLPPEESHRAMISDGNHYPFL